MHVLCEQVGNGFSVQVSVCFEEDLFVRNGTTGTSVPHVLVCMLTVRLQSQIQ